VFGVTTDEVLLHDAVSGFHVTMTSNKIITIAVCVSSYGARAPRPLELQLFNFSGLLRSMQTLTFNFMWFPVQ